MKNEVRMTMNNQDYELLSQYVDGELDPITSAQLQRRLDQEESLRRALQAMQALNTRIHAAFMNTNTVPGHIPDLLGKKQSNVVAFPQINRQSGWGFAIAATLLATSGLLMFQNGGQMAGSLSAQDALISFALDQTPSRGEGWDTLDDGSDFRPVLSFQTVSGQWCREYLLHSEASMGRGVACNTDGTWMTEVFSSQSEPGTTNEYRPAGANDADAVAYFVAEQAASVALSAIEETQMIANDWQ
ncbi:MAG: type II secretory pathway component PulJ [Halieaceae bacterium]|jgi:type II secretory pathway component PulJ